MKKYALLFQGIGYQQNFTADNIEMGTTKQVKILNYLISKEGYGSFKSYTSLMNSVKFIHCFLSKQSKRALFHLPFALQT